MIWEWSIIGIEILRDLWDLWIEMQKWVKSEAETLANECKCVWLSAHFWECYDDLELPQRTTGWWFGTFFIFPYIANNHPNWLIFFRGVQTTNQTISMNIWTGILSTTVNDRTLVDVSAIKYWLKLQGFCRPIGRPDGNVRRDGKVVDP